MPVSQKYAVGTKLIHRDDHGLTAEILASKSLNGIEHYLVTVKPNYIHASPFWLSGFGLGREFVARERRAGGPGERALFGRVARLFRGGDAKTVSVS